MNQQKRPIRIGNVSGAMFDPGYHMYNQATSGPIDALTGDYLAELTIAANAAAYHAGKHPGWEKTAEDGLLQTLEIIANKNIKVVINGGALNPSGLAQKIAASVMEKQLNLKIAYITGDDVLSSVEKYLDPKYGLKHLDGDNNNVEFVKDTDTFLADPNRQIVTANAYLGSRGIQAALKANADIIICGRVADASPVIGLAAWWHDWNETNFDALAGAFVAGHLIECSSYITGCNFCDFDRYPIEKLINVGLPIAEVAHDGSCIITKHESLNGIVNVDTVKCQLLYELQGNIYVNSDVTADLTNIKITQEDLNRVYVTGAKGHPPPPTTKLAIFYIAGYQCELTVNATGRNAHTKFAFYKRQIQHALKEAGTLDKFDILDFQFYAKPEDNPISQQNGTSYMRIFAQAKTEAIVGGLATAFGQYLMQHYSGMHWTNDMRTMVPKQFLGYYPGVLAQSELKETAVLLDNTGKIEQIIDAGHVSVVEVLGQRENYDPTDAIDLNKFGPTIKVPVDTVILGRSGDKGGNVNLGLFVHEADEYEWFRNYFTRERLQQLIGDDWKKSYFIERVEMPHIYAIHYVVYGILGRGVSSSIILDNLGKGFADYIRSKHIDIPEKFVRRYDGKTYDN
ncbi:unnamed protein product [Adineta steineri]|uniref:DUF1446 domain-containing protein n=1 Tax=Adineta steineri TaxID=433720 RepID=A0A819B7A7_9BILA|nr:unnamed protein product [Adineta steineri]